MKKNRVVSVVALGAAAAMGLSACGGGTSNGGNNGGGGTTTPGFGAAVGKVFNPSDTKGGTLRFANSGDWDSLDPADTYYGYSWNFIRNYGRGLVVFKSAPGAEGNKLAPDLAEKLGEPSNDAKTWTYKLRKGIKYEDGTEVKSKDVKYAVLRSLDKTTFPNGPTYLGDFLAVPDGYKGPYADPNVDAITAIETPDDYTIKFNLKTSFSGFDYFMALPSTIPVPQAKDTGTKYKEHVISTGPYKFETNELGKKFVLVRNEHYDPKSDPDTGRKPLADKIQVELNVNADDVDNRLQSGDLDISIEGTGVQPAGQAKVLNDPALKAKSDNPVNARTWFTVLNSEVAPLDNIDCRKAVLYAADKTAYQRSYGGATGGDIATSLMPPVIPGQKKIDLYEALTKPEGDVDKAKEALAKCGKPDGFSTAISYRAERPKEKATAEAMQQALGRVGIKLEIKPFPLADYTKLYVGKPDFAKANNIGLIIYGWGADWNDGFGFMQQIVDSRVIRAAGGNTNLGIRLPEVDKTIDEALKETDTAKREALWAKTDELVMQNAAALPGVWSKGLLYRPENLTNVFVTEAFGMYDYTAIGTSRK
ncbi:ABC transporter substrate-binding protein [Alloactinosynnema sp. L-07]|uniref:ABC transporter substrate-binding protein n=1 Tax=Alloactinosynnema sp. L-07 TaxID=1653480 RepID=UPI0006B623FD|nr:ABC transporter substrate-binding protein [Alloactinosynnema sp. L-07]